MARETRRMIMRLVKGQTVLVAVDGSPAANAAVRAAIEVATGLGSPVRFVHAASALAERFFDEDPVNGPTEERILSSDPVLADALARARGAGLDATVEIIAGHGDTADVAATLAGIADGLGAGLIVCGSRGRGAVAGAVLGSVSHNLIRHASVPVLIVHETNGAAGMED
jgi:nucleotide-binding universal stress UspA family protein